MTPEHILKLRRKYLHECEQLKIKTMKKDSMKIKNMVTGKVVTVWPSTDHPDSSYGMPQWVDKDNNSYGQCDIWPVPFGFEKISMYKFTESQYQEFRSFLMELNKVNWGTWDNRQWLHFDGMPGYAINQYEQNNGTTFVVVKFDSEVETPYSKGKRFKVGGGRNFQPVCQRF